MYKKVLSICRVCLFVSLKVVGGNFELLGSFFIIHKQPLGFRFHTRSNSKHKRFTYVPIFPIESEIQNLDDSTTIPSWLEGEGSRFLPFEQP